MNANEIISQTKKELSQLPVRSMPSNLFGGSKKFNAAAEINEKREEIARDGFYRAIDALPESAKKFVMGFADDANGFEVAIENLLAWIDAVDLNAPHWNE